MRAWQSVLVVALIAGCAAPGDEVASTADDVGERRERAVSRQEFERSREAVLAFAAPLGARDKTSLVIELDAERGTFSAKAESVKPSAEEKVQGLRFRRRIVVGAGVLAEPRLTADGLVLLLCHELGHHYGGYPFQKSDKLTTAEGSADYFATRVCAPALFRDGKVETTPPAPTALADERCSSIPKDRALCSRLVAASLSVTRALHAHAAEAPETTPPYAAAAPEPSLGRHDALKVERTVAGRYPSLQCRLDTLVGGALCGLAAETTVGEYTPSETEAAALEQSCSATTRKLGARPPCWFREGSIPTSSADPIDLVWRGR